MKTKIVKMGKSQGIRIPKSLIEQAGLKSDVEIRIEKNRIIISAARRPRVGWAEAFRDMQGRGDDAPLGNDSLESPWDKEEWRWPGAGQAARRTVTRRNT